jgi:hypothetical protein
MCGSTTESAFAIRDRHRSNGGRHLTFEAHGSQPCPERFQHSPLICERDSSATMLGVGQEVPSMAP